MVILRRELFERCQKSADRYSENLLAPRRKHFALFDLVSGFRDDLAAFAACGVSR